MKIPAFIKGLAKSKVFWINIGIASVEIVNELSGQVIPTKYAIEFTAIVNILLRLVTNKPLKDK